MSSSAVELSTDKQTVGDEVQGTITASLSGEDVGHLDFADYLRNDGNRFVQIRQIVVSPDHQREGIGTALVAELRQQVPTSRLARPNLNPSGRAFMEAIYDRFAEPIS